MLRNLLTWNRRRRKWNTEHESAWRGVSVHSGEDRLSPFQRDCEGALESALSGIGCQLVERVVEMPAGNEYIAAKVASTDVRAWIHDDTAGFDAPAGSRRFEEWDYRTPADLITDFCEHVVRASRPAA
jgi:hypothetical protein